jgi:hypothetical protein
MRSVVWGTSVVAIACTALLAPRPAHACGGCFSVPVQRQVTVVTGHRMAFSVSPKQSVLWDQIVYSGSPQDFAWVLPVHAGATIELSHDEFFAALDALTSPVITGPSPACGGGGGFACGASSAGNALSAGESNRGNGVQVISQGVVGPYDTVTVRSSNPNALYAWLVANQYDIPSNVRPVIDAYVTEHFDFIALRLSPGQGVQAMKPVRVVTPGAGLSLPLRMVAAGVGANVGITLYVISDGRYQAHNFSNGVVDDSKLVWLHAQNQSNYQTLAEQVMQGNGGRTWLTEFAQTTALYGSANELLDSGLYQCGPVATGNGPSYYGPQSLAALYYSACLCQGPTCPQSYGPDDGGAGAGEAGADAAALAPDAGCVPEVCAGFDDLTLASSDLDPNSTWVTRMRAIVPSNVLTEGDLAIEAASSQTPVSSQHKAAVYDDPTYDACPNSGCATAQERPLITGRALVAGSLAFLGFALARRRRRRAAGARVRA